MTSIEDTAEAGEKEVDFTSIKASVAGDMEARISGPSCEHSLTTISDSSQCHHWIPWRKALNVKSQGGGYVVEYLFFVLYSVCMCPSSKFHCR